MCNSTAHKDRPRRTFTSKSPDSTERLYGNRSRNFRAETAHAWGTWQSTADFRDETVPEAITPRAAISRAKQPKLHLGDG